VPGARALARAEHDLALDDLAVAIGLEMDDGFRRQFRDHPGEVCGLLDMRPVDRGEHVARLDAGMGGRASGVRLLEDRTVGLHHAEAVSKGRCHRTDCDADPAAGIGSLRLRAAREAVRFAGKRHAAEEGNCTDRDTHAVDSPVPRLPFLSQGVHHSRNRASAAQKAGRFLHFGVLREA
jgi:hypothetical protein